MVQRRQGRGKDLLGFVERGDDGGGEGGGGGGGGDGNIASF